jgi:heme exporter protein D
MIEGGWPFIWAAYGVSMGALAVLVAVVVARLAHWSKAVRALDEAKRERAQ